MSFLLDDANLVFTAALGVVLAIAALEVVTTLFGASLSGLVDSILPDMSFDLDADADIDAAQGAGGPVGGILAWLCVGKVPALVLLIAFLTGFGAAGLVVQSLVAQATGALLPGWFAALPALAVALPATRFLGLGLARVFPEHETYAVSADSFVGRAAVITIGTAAAGQPAEARLRDEHGRTHYVRVEPLDPADSFPAGTEVVLRRKQDSVFKAVAAHHPEPAGTA